MLPNIDTFAGGNQVRRPEAERTAEAVPAAQQSQAQENKAKKAETGIHQVQDRVEINLTLTPEEREAFIAAFSSKQDPGKMSDEEKATLQGASERISSFIDDAIARNTGNRERVEKAMSEWYSRVTQGESPVDLVKLLRETAMGQLTDLGQ